MDDEHSSTNSIYRGYLRSETERDSVKINQPRTVQQAHPSFDSSCLLMWMGKDIKRLISFSHRINLLACQGEPFPRLMFQLTNSLLLCRLEVADSKGLLLHPSKPGQSIGDTGLFSTKGLLIPFSQPRLNQSLLC